MEITDFKVSDWKRFKEDPCYLFLMQEFEDRSKVLTTDLIIGSGSKEGDDVLRGRISEILFKTTTVDSFIEELEAVENPQKTNTIEKEIDENAGRPDS